MQICTDFVFVMKVTTVMVVRKVITHFLENVIHIVLAPVQAQRQKIERSREEAIRRKRAAEEKRCEEERRPKEEAVPQPDPTPPAR